MSHLNPGKKYKRPEDEKRNRAYDEVIKEMQVQRNGWRLLAFILVGISTCFGIGLVYLGSQPKTIPHVIEITPWGEARYRGAIGTNTSYDGIPRTPESISYYLKAFIQNTRGLSSDLQVVRDRLNTALNSVTQNAHIQIREAIDAENPFRKARETRVDIEIESLLLVAGTDNSYQVDWLEMSRSISGQGYQNTDKYYRGIFTIIFAEPSDQQVVYNPLGIFIEAYQITEIQRES